MNDNAGISKWVAGKRSKWVTLLVWIVAAALLSALLPSASSHEDNNAPNLSQDKPSMQAEAIADREFSSGADVPALYVWHREGGLTDADIAGIGQWSAKLTEAKAPHQTSMPPLHLLPPEALKAELSSDNSTIVVPVLFDKQADADQLKEGIEHIRETTVSLLGENPFDAPTSEPGMLSIRVTGPVGIQIDATGLFKNADVSLMIGTVLLVLILLLLIYRSPILALIPLVAVGFAYGVINPLLGWMASEGWIVYDSQALSIMTVLLFGAGTDYCLFLISRFRQLLKSEENAGKALLAAVTGSSGAIAMSGLTVVLSLFALLFAEYGVYHRFAAPFGIAILIMGIASLTLVPSLLAIIGRGSFFPFVPRTPAMRAERAKRKGLPATAEAPAREPRNWAGRSVVAKPGLIIAVCVIVLGGFAAYATQIKVTYDILSSFPKDMDSREGFALIGDKFSPGELAPVKVIVDTQGKDVALGDKLAALPYVDRVSEPQTGANNPNIVLYEAQLSMNPYSIEAMELVPDLREAAEQTLAEAGVADADRAWIGGPTAEQHDAKAAGDRDTLLIIPIVIGLITLLLLAYLRSVVATVYLVLTVILSYFSALGLGWLVLHYGFGADAIQGSIPLYAFVFLVALGEDYNIFMISSIWQKRGKMPLGQAIREGVGDTGAVITSAGLILAGTFAVLATLPIQALVQFGLITAIGVLLDTFVVRPFLVPAITMKLGEWAFWPSKPQRSSDSARQ